MNISELINACITLMKYSLTNKATGADFDIDTPNGTVHFTYDFTINFNNQEDE